MTEDFEYFKKELASRVARIKAGKLKKNELLSMDFLASFGLDGKEFEAAQKLVIIATCEIDMIPTDENYRHCRNESLAVKRRYL